MVKSNGWKKATTPTRITSRSMTRPARATGASPLADLSHLSLHRRGRQLPRQRGVRRKSLKTKTQPPASVHLSHLSGKAHRYGLGMRRGEYDLRICTCADRSDRRTDGG